MSTSSFYGFRTGLILKQKSAMNMLEFEKTGQDALIIKAPSLMMLHDFKRNTNHVCVVIGMNFDFNKIVINKFNTLGYE